MERTILRQNLNVGDCIGYLIGEDYTTIHIGIIKSFISNSIIEKSTIVLTDGKHVPIEKIRHRIKSNQIELTK